MSFGDCSYLKEINKLTDLDLGDNYLRDIPVELFMGMGNVEYLYLYQVRRNS